MAPSVLSWILDILKYIIVHNSMPMHAAMATGMADGSNSLTWDQTFQGDAVAFSPLTQSGGEDPANFATYLPGPSATLLAQTTGVYLMGTKSYLSPGYSPTSPFAPASPLGPAPPSPYGTSPFVTSPLTGHKIVQLPLCTLPPHPSSTLPHPPSPPRHQLSLVPQRAIKCCQANPLHDLARP